MMITSSADVLGNGVRYEIRLDAKVVWARFIQFGMDRRHRAGGAAFVEAARAQEAAIAGYVREKETA